LLGWCHRWDGLGLVGFLFSGLVLCNFVVLIKIGTTVCCRNRTSTTTTVIRKFYALAGGHTVVFKDAASMCSTFRLQIKVVKVESGNPAWLRHGVAASPLRESSCCRRLCPYDYSFTSFFSSFPLAIPIYRWPPRYRSISVDVSHPLTKPFPSDYTPSAHCFSLPVSIQIIV